MNIKIALKVTEVNKKTLIYNITETGWNSKFTFQSEHWRLKLIVNARFLIHCINNYRPVIVLFSLFNEKLK